MLDVSVNHQVSLRIRPQLAHTLVRCTARILVILTAVSQCIVSAEDILFETMIG
jgi:hypothetical protein